MDILHDGGCAVRVSLQGCLILWLCLFTTVATASYTVSTEEQAWAKCWDLKATKSGGYYNTADWSCKFNGDSAIILSNVNSGGTADMVRFSTPCEYGRDETGCAGPEPEACFEMGQVYDPQSGQCTLNCPEGQLNGQCLQTQDECTPDRSDYMGKIGAGGIAVCGNDLASCGTGTAGIVHGKVTCIPDDYGPPSLCPEGSISRFDGYGFTCDKLPDGMENPQWADGPPNVDTNGDGAPDAYDPSLDGGSGYHAIKNLYNQNSVVINQNNITNNNLTNINESIKREGEKAAEGMEGIAGQLGGMASDLAALKQMGEAGELAGGGGASGGGEGLKNEAGEDYLGDLADIKQNTKDTADTLTEIKDGPEGGYNTEGLGDAPTFSESSDRLQLAITGHPTIQAVTTIPSIASNNTCPVWTIPATDYWSAMPIDSHCQILTDHRGLLSMLFIAVWTLAAVFVFLRA